MFRWFKKRLKPHATDPSPVKQERYWIYTTEFDEVVFASDLVLEQSIELQSEAAEGWYDRFLQDVATADSALGHIQNLSETSLDRLKSNAVAGGARAPATMLIDHSGSLRSRASKQGHFKAYFTAMLFASMAQASGTPFEILGFTTSQWKGGEARKRWLQDGRPSNPGRLCPLRHIVYSEFEDVTEPDVRAVLRPDILKENIDGEALLWAWQRLEAFAPERGSIIVVSDGAPVDDSTLAANDSEYLMDHLKSVVQSIRIQGKFGLYGIGIDHDLSSLYPDVTRLSAKHDFEDRVVPFLETILAARTS